MRSMAQKRAEYALERVIQANSIVADKDKFPSFVSGTPSMILQNGFGQTLAFLLAKGTKDGRIKDNDKHIVVFKMVQDWLALKKGDVDNRFTNATDMTGLIGELSTMDQRTYLSAQNEALALLEWAKRFANADLS